MTRHLVVRPQARLELAEASDWYDDHHLDLGGELIHAFEAAMESIERNPFQFQVIYEKARRVNLAKFPYSVIYTVSDDEIIVLSCFHSSRDPKRWQSRLP